MNNNYSRKLGRWSLARNQNVNFVYNLFRENFERVELLIDKNQNDMSLVIVRADHFNKIFDASNEAPLRKILGLKDEIIAAQRETIKALKNDS